MINSEAYLTYILQKIANIKENILRKIVDAKNKWPSISRCNENRKPDLQNNPRKNPGCK